MGFCMVIDSFRKKILVFSILTFFLIIRLIMGCSKNIYYRNKYCIDLIIITDIHIKLCINL